MPLSVEEKNRRFKLIADAIDVATDNKPAVVYVFEDGSTEVGDLLSPIPKFNNPDRKGYLGSIQCTLTTSGDIRYVILSYFSYSEKLTLDAFSKRYYKTHLLGD